MVKEKEGVKSQEEGIASTPPAVEGEKSTQQQEAPTLKTYDEADFQRAVSKGLESTNRQLELQRAEAKKAQAELKQRDIDLKAIKEEVAELEKLHFAEDPEVREAYVSRKTDRESKRDIAKREAELESQRYDLELERWKLGMNRKASELMQETGISFEELKDCQTEEEMEVKALRYQFDKSKSQPEAREPQKFDSGLSSGGGLSDDEFERRFGSGELDATAENIKRAKAITDRRLKGG